MRNQRGFSFIEMIIVLSIMAVVAGTLVPVGVQVLERERERVTAENMRMIADAMRAYYFEYRDWPRTSTSNRNISLFGLVSDTMRRGTNWRGPFLSYSGPNDARDTDNIVVFDKWRRAYTISPSNAPANTRTLTITSQGIDARNNADNITQTVYVGDIVGSFKGQQTLAEINAINASLNIYKTSGYNPKITRSTSWRNALRYMQTRNLLPGTNGRGDYSTDEWGSAYQFDGVLVKSPNLP